MSSPMEIREITEEHDRAAVLSLVGELDVLTAPECYQRGAHAIEDRHSLVLDMSGVTFCDSSGFNALVRLRRRAEEAGGRLVLAAPPQQVLSLLALSGAEAFFPVLETVAEARAAYAAPSPG